MMIDRDVPWTVPADETNDLAVANELDWCLWIEFRLVSIWVEEPIVIRILVVVACNLLLLRTFRIRRDVRM